MESDKPNIYRTPSGEIKPDVGPVEYGVPEPPKTFFSLIRSHPALAILTLLVVLGVPAFLWGKPFYNRLMVKRLLSSADASEAKDKPEEALRFLVEAFRRNPGDTDVLLAMEVAMRKIQHPQLLEIQEQIAARFPDNVERTLDCIETALRSGRALRAQTLLKGLDTTKLQGNARFQHLTSLILFAQNRLEQSYNAAAKALELEPNSLAYRTNFATLLLSAPDEKLRLDGVRRLEELLEHKPIPSTVIDSLLRLSLQASGEPPNLDRWLEASRDRIKPNDPIYVVYLNVLKRWRPDQLEAGAEELLKNAKTDSGAAASAVGWLKSEGRWEQLIGLRESLSDEARRSLAGLTAHAEALFRSGRFEELGKFLAGPEWKNAEAAHYAWLERMDRRTASKESTTAAVAANWQRALQAAKSNPLDLLLIATLARDWGWDDNYLEAMWTVIGRNPLYAVAALQDLWVYYFSHENGRGMLRVARKKLELDSKDSGTRNNYAFLSFLYKSDLPKAEQVIDGLCKEYPDVVTFKATQAFGRLQAGDLAGGLKILQPLNPSSLKGRDAGVVYGLLLAASGNPEASQYLVGVDQLLHLPEERANVIEARKKLGAN